MQAKIATGYVKIETVGVLDGISCLSVSCPDFDAFRVLPAALEYEGKIHGLRGFDSDIGMAYYKTSALLAKVVQK